jgi:hypothetical protein
MKNFVKIFAIFAFLAASAHPEHAGPRTFLVLKTGEKLATDEIAGPTVAGLTKYLGQKLGQSDDFFAPKIENEPEKALAIARANKPLAGIVTPAFYFSHRETLPMHVAAEVRRIGLPAERYAVVVHEQFEGDLESLRGKTIATTLVAEKQYVARVILQGKLGDDVALAASTDLDATVIDIAEKVEGAPIAALLDLATWDFYRRDAQLGPQLKAVFQSDVLPRDLVVVFTQSQNGLDAASFQSAVLAMDKDAEGRAILRSIRVETFDEVDRGRLRRAEQLFHGQ